MDETTLKSLKVIEDKDIAIKELSSRLEGYYIVTRFLLEKINYDIIDSQTPQSYIIVIHMKLKSIH